ncbi:MAG: hypothetical protein IJ131_07375, partial [Eggerthellaceae bacterium]|nr:hypothetical protein [Eggerthellaceae bacterium]
ALLSLLAILFRIFDIPAVLVSLLCALFYVFELMDRPFLSRLFDRGVSQNVVARYVPGKNADARGRKVVLVANYDSSKVSAELSGGVFSVYPMLVKASAVALVALPVIWLIRSLFLLHATGPAVVFLNILAAIALILALVPVARFFMHRFATYNEAANNNATGVAAVVEVARLISEGSLSEEEIAAQEGGSVHDAETAHEAGVVPEGAELVYASGVNQSEAERLAAAKAAVAAITGKPLRAYRNEDVVSLIEVTDREDSLKDMDYGEYGYPQEGEDGAPLEEASAQFTSNPVTKREVAPAPVEGEGTEEGPHEAGVGPAAESASTSTVATYDRAHRDQKSAEPSWYTAGKAKAAKPSGADSVPIRRSRYADALEVALETSRQHVEEAARMLDEGSIEAISQMQRAASADQAETPAEEPTATQQLEAPEMPEPTEEKAIVEESASEEADVPKEDRQVESFREQQTASLEPLRTHDQDVSASDGAAMETAEQEEALERAKRESSQAPVSERKEEREQQDEPAPREEPAAEAGPAQEEEPKAEDEPALEEDSSKKEEPQPKTESRQQTGQRPEPTFRHKLESRHEPAPGPKPAPLDVPAIESQPEIVVPEVDVSATTDEGRPATVFTENITAALPSIGGIRDDGPAPLESVMLSYEEVELLDGATTSMPPIDVSSLRDPSPALEPVRRYDQDPHNLHNQQSKKVPEVDVHDFSQIEAVRGERQSAEDAPAARRSHGPSLKAARPVGPRPQDDVRVEASEGIREDAQTNARAFAEEDKRRTPRVNLPYVVETDQPEEMGQAGAEEAKSDARKAVAEKRAALRSAIPTLSGEFVPSETATDEENAEVSKTGSFAAVGSATSIEPVGDELVADLAPEDRYVEDADDSTFDEGVTETGALAGPDYVDMPESRISRFFNRFRKKREEEQSTAEWLNVEEGFDPTEERAARGGWESFRNDSGDEELYEEVDEGAQDGDAAESDDRAWHGGAFSRSRAKGEEADGVDDIVEEEEAEQDASDQGVDAAGRTGELVDEDAAEDEGQPKPAANTESPAMSEGDDHIAEEVAAIYNFRNPDINTEVWFVALGSEYAGNGGMKAFLAEHADDLRGAVVINLEAMGAGELSFIEEEGCIITRRPSSRLKRFLHKATEVTGLSTPHACFAWRDSAASVAMRRGFQAMTLAGVEKGKPALLGQGDDVVENIDESMVAENARFLLELIKNI